MVNDFWIMDPALHRSGTSPIPRIGPERVELDGTVKGQIFSTTTAVP